MHLIDFDLEHAAPITQYGSCGASAQLLAAGAGGAHVYAVHFGVDGQIGPHPAGFGQLFLVVSGVGWIAGADGVRQPVRTGQAGVIVRGELHSKGSESGCSALMVQLSELSLPPVS